MKNIVIHLAIFSLLAVFLQRFSQTTKDTKDTQ